jgi:hypothetical protein
MPIRRWAAPAPALYARFVEEEDGEGADFSATLPCCLVGSIFLHELGHAWGATVQGVPVRRIVINGGGGFCEQARSATRRQDELIVAMGPIVNLTIWAAGSLAAPPIVAPFRAWHGRSILP